MSIDRCSLSRSKKANVFFEGLSIFHAIIMLIIFGIIGLMLFTDLNVDFQADPDNGAFSKELMQEAYDQYPSMWDDIIIIVFVGMWLFALISAFFIDTHPLFFVVSAILLVLLLIFIVYISNGAYDIFIDGDFETYYSQFPKTAFIFEHILTVMIVIGASVLVTLYARR